MTEQNVIVGAGQAGTTAAFAMRKAGFAGRILLVGDEEHIPYERPPLSKDVLLAAEARLPSFFPQSRYAEEGIELVLNRRVDALDVQNQRLEFTKGETIPYDRLLIATGGRPRHLDVPGSDAVLYMRSFTDALSVRQRVAEARSILCVGAGVIGLEVASSLARADREVRVVEAGPTALSRAFAPAEAQFIEELHRSAGVSLAFSTEVVSIEPHNGAHCVTFSDGSKFIADCIVAGIGMERNTELAEAADIQVDYGILVDEYGESSANNVFAAGDVANFWHPEYTRRMRLESWHHAQSHGQSVGKTMAGVPVSYRDIPRFWTDQYKQNIQIVGFPREAATTIIRGDRASGAYMAFHMSEGDIIVGATAVNAPQGVRPAVEMIRSRRQIDSNALRDTSLPLVKLARGLALSTNAA